MKPAMILVSLALLLLTGCYSMLVVNFGVANKSASALQAPLDPAVACTALASPRVTITAKAPVAGDAAQDWIKTCEAIIAKQEERKKKP